MRKSTDDDRNKKPDSALGKDTYQDSPPPPPAGSTSTPLGGLFALALIPIVLGLLLAFTSMKGCEQHKEDLASPDPARVWEEGIRQEKEHSGNDPQAPEWMQQQEKQP